MKNKEPQMRVYVTNTVYDDDDYTKPALDILSIPFIEARNPLYIGTRTSQVNRVAKLITEEKLDGTSIGYWELVGEPTYLTKKGKLHVENLRKHDVIFISNSDRCDAKYKKVYEDLIKALKDLV